MITGAGRIGSLIACLLAESKDYHVHLADVSFTGGSITRLMEVLPQINLVTLDVTQAAAIQGYLVSNDIHVVVSSLPYFLNVHVAEAAKLANAHYFDITEDTTVSEVVRKIASNAKKAFVPQCGLAPGFISIVANHFLKTFDVCKQAKLRVGALPQQASNALHYSLTWSTDGIINEYGNPCFGIENGELAILKPLEGLESIQIEGTEYEAFNTSGGIGSLGTLYEGKINHLTYKTIRYPGHCEKMRFLMNDLKLNEDRGTLKRLLEQAIPKTHQDVVLIYVAVDGYQEDTFIEKSYVKKIYPKEICGLQWSAIQISTAASVCAVVDLVLHRPDEYQGLVFQEYFDLNDLLNNRFGKHYA